jgi:hypothetical protein
MSAAASHPTISIMYFSMECSLGTRVVIRSAFRDSLLGKQTRCNEIRYQGAGQLGQDERRGILRPNASERI